MTEISTIIRARLDEGRAIADEDVRALLNENERLREALRRIGKGNVCETTLSYPPICYRALTARNSLEGKETTND